MGGSPFAIFEERFVARIRRYPDAVIPAPPGAVQEGFEYLGSPEYLNKPGAVHRAKNMRAMLTSHGPGSFFATAGTMAKNILSMAPNMRRNFSDIESYVDELETTGRLPAPNPSRMHSFPNVDLWDSIRTRAWDRHKMHVGFTEVPDGVIFEGKVIPFRYALVFIQEMASEAIDKAPDPAAGREVVRVYNSLGQGTNDMAQWLRDEHQVHCQANHPLGGLVDFVPLAEKAGLGRIGHNGLLITPQFGTRCRISPIFVQEPLFPFTDTDEFAWIDDFCMACRNCERACPTAAILPEPRVTAPEAYGNRDRAETIDRERCYQFFSTTLGCAVCIKVCPFVRTDYERIKTGWDRRQAKVAVSALPAVAPTRAATEPSSVAIVGAGPAGLFATKELLASTDHTNIDIYERLPVPFGLVRYGVAPDHPEVKSKAFWFHDILRSHRVRFFGNVTLGVDVTLDDLRSGYDAVILATGASRGRQLGIPGEGVPGSLSAPEFVGWYNGHPDFFDLRLPERATSAVVIGAGNVALDTARMLLKDPRELRHTDIATGALEHLSRMGVKDVHLLIRRGPSQASFTPKELAELLELSYVEGVMNHRHLEQDGAAPGTEPTKAAEIRALLATTADVGSRRRAPKRVFFHFFSMPRGILGTDHVTGIDIEETAVRVEDGRITAHATGRHTQLPAELVIRSIGYRSDVLPGVPVQDSNGIIRNEGGRVLDSAGTTVGGLYTSGWIRRGPSGIIGTNKTDAKEVVATLLHDCRPTARSNDPMTTLGARTVDTSDLELILAEERVRGANRWKHSEKFTQTADMVSAIPSKGE